MKLTNALYSGLIFFLSEPKILQQVKINLPSKQYELNFFFNCQKLLSFALIVAFSWLY